MDDDEIRLWLKGNLRIEVTLEKELENIKVGLYLEDENDMHNKPRCFYETQIDIDPYSKIRSLEKRIDELEGDMRYLNGK